MITELTKQQEDILQQVKNYWIDKVYGCAETDEDATEVLINFMYKQAGLKTPKVVITDSPMTTLLTIHILNNTSETVGDSVRGSMWDSVDDSVGDSVRASVSDSVRDSVSDSVRASVNDPVRDSVWLSLWDSVWISVNASMRDSVKSSVKVSVADSLWDFVRASVSDSVWASVGASLKDLVGDSKIEYYTHLDYGEPWSQGWQAFFDFFTRQTGLVKDEKFEQYINLVDKANAYYIVPFKHMCFVSRAPKYINRTELNGSRYVMHNDEGKMAIEWRDGWGQYVLHGITVEKEMYFDIIEKKKSFKEVMGISNMEHRMLFLKYLDAEQLLKGANAELIDTGEKVTMHFDYDKNDGSVSSKLTNNQLYKIVDIFNEDAYFLRYEDPSTGRVYISGVDPEVGIKGDADLCMAWKFGISKEQYMNLEVQS